MQEHEHCGGEHGSGQARHPFRFEVRGRRFSSYTVMLYAGLVVALVVAHAVARRTGLDARRVVLAMLVAIPAALVGARALAVLLAWRHFRARPGEIARLDRGGAAMYGGLLPAVLLSAPLLAWLGVPLRGFWDVAAVAILAGMIPTRLGCLTNGCCAGRAMGRPFGLLLPAAHGGWERRFPSPLAEAALAGALLALLHALWGALPFPGAAFLLALGGYAAGRFLLDGLRARRGPVLAGLGACQWISLVLLAACAGGFLAGARFLGAQAPAGTQVLAAGASGADLALLIASGALLLPILNLFRFLGCDLIFKLKDPPRQKLQLAAIIPPAGPTDTFTATISMFVEPDMTEIGGSPFELPSKAPLADGSLVFETLVDLVEGSYTAACRVESATVATRLGTCSGELHAPSLAVVFFASPLTLPNAIDPIICFEIPPP